MSCSKFCFGNISLAPALHDFRTLFDGQEPILVIDEIDSTRSVFEDFILKQALSHKDDLIQIFDALHQRLLNLDSLPKLITNLKSAKSGKYSMESLAKKADEIYQKYNLNLELKYDGGSGFSLFSSTYYNTTGRSYSYMEYEETRNNMLIHIVNYREYRKYLERYKGIEDKCFFPTWLIKSLWRFVRRFRFCLLQWALEYKKCVDDWTRKRFQEEQAAATNRRKVNHPHAILIDDACRSILDTLRVGVRSQQDILMPHFQEIQIKRQRKFSEDDWLETLNKIRPVHPYFDTGYALTNLCNDSAHHERTEIRFFSKPYAAEGLLTFLSQKFMVIGLSATARIPSIANYFLPYLVEKLGDSFYPMSTGLRRTLQKFYDHLEKSYQKNHIQIHTSVLLDPEQGYVIPEDYYDTIELDRFLSKFYQSETVRESIAEEIEKTMNEYGGDNTEYIFHRYMQMLYGLWQFYQAPTSHAWLYLNSKLPCDDPKFKESLLRSFKKSLDKEFPTRNVSFYVLRSKGADGSSFELERDKIRKDLKQGQDVVVFSAYNSVGVGIDLDYESAYHKDDYLDVYPDDPHKDEDARHKRRDFDGFVFGEITYLLENMLEFAQERESEEKEYRRHQLISNILTLAEIHQIYRMEGNAFIQELLEPSPNYRKLANKIAEFRTHSYIAGQVQYKLTQAIGRGNRAFCKNKNIYIFLADKNIESLINAEPEPEYMIHTPEWNTMIQFVEKRENQVISNSRQMEQFKRILVNSCYYEEDVIRRLLSFNILKNMIWTDIKVKTYELLGRLVICFPTYDDIEYVIRKMQLTEEEAQIVRQFADGYLEFHKNINQYEYLRMNKLDRIFPFSGMDRYSAEQEMKRITGYQGPITSGKVSSMDARLDFLFEKVPGLKEYFEEMGYATSFKSARRIMCPTLFTNFYKGRLGEIVGTWILRTYGGIDVKPITDNSYYEIFDAIIGNGQSMIDFKNWKLLTGMCFVHQSELYNKVQSKLEHIRSIHPDMGKRAYIIRLCQTSDEDELLDHATLPPLREAINHDIITVLNLVTDEGVNMDAIKLIKQLEERH